MAPFRGTLGSGAATIAIGPCSLLAGLLLAACESTSPDAPLISTDRPSFSTSTGFVPEGYVQLEAGYTYAHDEEAGVEIDRHNGPEALLRYALVDGFELRGYWNGFLRATAESGGTETVADGATDPAVGVKWLLTEEDRFPLRMALEGLTTLGVATEDVSSGEAEPTLKWLWSRGLAPEWGVGGTLALASPVTGGDRYLQGQASVYLTYAPAADTGIFAEWFTFGGLDDHHASVHAVDAGITQRIGTSLQLDARVGFGLEHDADDFFTGFGISWLF
jgi:hypothetical protein